MLWIAAWILATSLLDSGLFLSFWDNSFIVSVASIFKISSLDFLLKSRRDEQQVQKREFLKKERLLEVKR